MQLAGPELGLYTFTQGVKDLNESFINWKNQKGGPQKYGTFYIKF